MSYRTGPNRSRPEWAKPLAPLPEWLDSIEQLLKSVDRPADRYGSRPVIEPTSNDECQINPWFSHIRCNRMRIWRKWRAISRSEAARILGYADAGVIARIEEDRRDATVKRDRRLQQRLAEHRWGEPIPDRCEWLRAWRERLGIYQWAAANILGYEGRCSIGSIENKRAVPAWERILVAIDAERALEDGFPLPE
jgi:predicted transcriptional regulator